jgi:hypothetical protein
MALSKNPFKPTFGASPPVLAGRDDLRQDFLDALDEGPGSPGRATIYTGARGTGKTVMLNAVEDDAKAQGWLVVAETATPGLVSRLTDEHLPRLLTEQDPEATKTRLTGVTMPVVGGGATWSTADAHGAVPDLRSQVTALCRILAEYETGLMVTVDELHRKPMAELVALITVVQHAIREELEFAFVGAGLPNAVSEVLEEDALTFLRRAERHDLGKVDDVDVALALARPITDAGRTIPDEALALAVEATGGYPFLIQLVGHRTWRQHPRHTDITVADVRVGTDEARRRLGSLVHGVAFKACSDIDKTFLLAMARDDGPAKLSDVADRLHVSRDYANVYRARLIAAQLVEPAGRGRLDFALPYLREYLREHGAIDHVSRRARSQRR